MNIIHCRRQAQEKPKRGRPPGSAYSDEERAQRHRQAALAWHHANKHKRKAK